MREMKDSRIEWIGQIPSTWRINKGKYFISLLNKPARETDEIITCFRDGEVTLRSNRREDGFTVSLTETGYQGIDVGDLIVHGMDGFAGAIGISDSRGKATPVLNVLNTTECKKYIMYLMRSMAYCGLFLSLSTGIRVRTCDTNWKKLREIDYLLPDLLEQQNIANFLDAKCAEIDALAADIQTQIDTLEQYKRSIITEAVTKGLNPDAVMKDSGIQWIGMMPSHWDCIRGKYILKYIQKPVREDDGVITCFRDGEVTLRSNRREDGFTMADKEIGYQGIDVGDLVVHGMDGFAGAIGISDSRGKASPVLNVLDTDQNKRYIMYFLRSMAYSDVFLALATGIRVRSCDLRWNKLAELFYPVPPVEEQDAIVAHIDAIIRRADAVIADKKAQLETIESYKKSLIYEYVTGKKTAPGTGDTIDSVVIDPHVVLAGIAINQLGENLKGKTELQKILYLFDAYLGINPATQYYRYTHGPYDQNLDDYLNTLVANGWFQETSNGAIKYKKGPKHADFCSKYEDAFAEYSREMSKLISFVKGMKHTSQIERIATAFAVWNDLILEGNSSPTDDEIIREIRTNWTPNKAHSPESTWKGDLTKMKRQGIVPTGQGLHTLPMPKRGVCNE